MTLSTVFSAIMEGERWTWCPTCYDRQWFMRVGGNVWECKVCGKTTTLNVIEDSDGEDKEEE